MTTGRPGLAPSARWLRDRLQGLGFSEDQFTVAPPPQAQQLSASDLEPASYNIEFASFVQRVQRLVSGGRGVSIFVTGPRNDLLARHHLAAQIAVGLAPLGRQVVIVDADVLRPGLSGLLADPYAEGLVDMVRFGRSTRSLLQHPVANGPWILPSGSFPADDPAPLAADALRSVVFRISQVCDLALYVGPLPIRGDIHPLARVCDHVLCAASEHAEPEAGARVVEQLGELQRNGTHVLGLVWYTLPETRLNPYETAAAAMAMPPAPESVRPVPEPDPFLLPPEPASAAGASESGDDFGFATPAFEPGFLYAPDEPAVEPAPVVDSPSGWVVEDPAAADSPPFEPERAAPAGPAEPPPFELERFGLGAVRKSEPAPGTPPFDFDAPPVPVHASPSEDASLPPLPDWEAAFAPPAAPGAAAALDSELGAELRGDAAWAAGETAGATPPEHAGEFDSVIFSSPGAGAETGAADTMRRAGGESHDALPSTPRAPDEFAFESESSDSRWIPIVVVSLVAIILVFVGWALWTRHHVNDQLVETGAVTAPQDAAAHGDVPKRVEPEPAATAPVSGSATPNDGAASTADTARAKVPEPAASTPRVTPPPAVAPPAVAPKVTAKEPPKETPKETPKLPAASRENAAGAAAVKPPARVAAPPPAAAGTGAAAAGVPFAVHVASYKTLGQASKEIAQLQKFGYTGNAVETDLGSKGTWYRVYVGSYSTVAEAEAARDAILKLPGYHFAIVHRLPR